jgi:outer membrane receptor protein involved in Fe transport
MKNIISLLLLFSTVITNAQTIKGKVCLEKDKSPVPFASVAVCQLPDTSMVTGGITLNDGAYQIDKLKPGNYFVRVSFVGYKTSGKAVTISEGQAEVTADTIFLGEITTSLNEVTVVGERLKGKELVDRTVYAVPPVVAKASTNGYEVLKKIPQVNVDFQNNITLNGSSNFIIQVDGRQRDKEFLAKLQPGDIQSIEIISNPSGKYEGNIDGVINVILKKEARYGLNGNLGYNIKPFNKVTSIATGSLDYAMGKITFYATAFTFSQGLDISTKNISHFLMNDSTASLSGNGGIKVRQSNVNTGFDYYMNDRNNMSFNISIKPIGQDIDIVSETELSRNSVPLSSISTLTGNSLKSNEFTASLFYKKTYAKPVEEFTAEATWYHFKSKENNDFSNKRFPWLSDSVLSTYSRYEYNLNNRDYYSAKLNYVYPIGMNAKLEAGYQLYYQMMNYDFSINHEVTSNMFEYDELRNSVYGGFTFNYKKFGFQTVLRVENSHIMADSVTSPDYSCFLPSVNLQYKFSASHNLKATYNRRINRPGIYDMDPYFKIGENYDISQGNPDLRPDYRDRFQLTYTWNFGSNYFSPYVYKELFSDKVSREFQVVKSPISNALTTLSKPYNLLSGSETGGGLNAMLWYININARIYKGHYNEYTSPTVTIPSRDYFSYSVTSYAFANFDKNKKTSVYVFLSYNGVNVNAQSKTYNIPFYGFGGQKTIKDHTFGLFWFLPLSGKVNLNRTETEVAGYRTTNIIGFNAANYIQFSYSWKFNKGRNVKKMDHKVDIESDSKSQAIGK